MCVLNQETYLATCLHIKLLLRSYFMMRPGLKSLNCRSHKIADSNYITRFNSAESALGGEKVSA